MRRRSEDGERPREQALRIPHDPVNEQVVIAATIVGWDKLARKHFAAFLPEQFFGRGHAAIWQGLQEIHRRGLHYDPATLQQVTGGQVDAEYVDQLVRDRPAIPPNLAYHLGCLRWDTSRVQLVRGPLAALHEALKDPTSDPDRVRALALAIPKALGGHGSYVRDTSQIVREHSPKLTRRREGFACVPFGIEGLDFYAEDEEHENAGMPRLIPGCAPGFVTVWVGVSGSGKTTSAMHVAAAQAQEKVKTLYGAWDSGDGMTLEACAALSLGLSRTDLLYGRFSEADQRELEQEMERLGEYLKFLYLPTFRNTKSGREKTGGNERNLDIIEQSIEDSGCQVFIADLFRRTLVETDPDDEERALTRMQNITQNPVHPIHTILLHQIRLKDVELRSDKRPTRESIKGSSAWVEVPDHIVAWYRQAMYKSVEDDRIESLILKHRHGPPNLAVEYEYDPVFGTITAGRSIEYLRPEEKSGLDGFLSENFTGKGKGRGRKTEA